MVVRPVIFWSTLLALLLPASAPTVATAQTVPPGAGKQWSPTFAAEFNGTTAADLAGWTYDVGNGQSGWGNQEVQSYTNSTNNVAVSGGTLHINAIGTQAGSNVNYTSGRIRTPNLFSQAYGLFEIRAKLPAGQGLWPAIWMMPKDSAYGGWPTSGEIDIMEATGHTTGRVQGTLHTGTSPQTAAQLTGTYQPAGLTTTDWHTYSLKWTAGASPSQPGTIQWYVDGNLYQTRSGGWVVPGGAANADAPFDKPFYLILNMAVGGTYANHLTPGAGSYEMQVDYARAYALTNVPEPASAFLVVVPAVVALFGRPRRVRLPGASDSRPHLPSSLPVGGPHVEAN